MDKKRTQVEEGAPASAASPGVKTGELAVRDVPAADVASARVRVNKAYKMYVGGAFVRSESGRYTQVHGNGAGADPETVNVPRGSRKDVRDAVLVAKNAADKWAARSAYNRGQILYRLAEVTESRTPELVESLVRAGSSPAEAAREVATAVDRTVFYAGFCDKISSLFSSHNPVSGPHFGFTIPNPMGVVGVVAPDAPSLLGLVSTILPIIATSNVVVATASETDPRTAIVWSECLATSDLPGGVVNILTGQVAELAPQLAKHREVMAFDGTFGPKATELRAELERLGADSVKRVKTRTNLSLGEWLDDRKGQGISWVERYVESKTVWHPVGV